MKIGILRETKSPPDRRSPLTPKQVSLLASRYPEHEFVVQSSELRAFADDEFRGEGIRVADDVSDAGLMLGVKEPTVGSLVPEKTYLVFSHTAKKQPQNRQLLQAASSLGITLVDYEYLIDGSGQRIIAFGYWAGITGAYNALRGYGMLSDEFSLLPPEKCGSRADLFEQLEGISADNPLHIVITGEGRVAGGAVEVLEAAGFARTDPDRFLGGNIPPQAYCQVGPQDYARNIKGEDFRFTHFMQHPEAYKSHFRAYTRSADVFIACHFWDPRGPHFFTTEEVAQHSFRIKLVADISCDIPGPVPTTLRCSNIDEPFYGVDRDTLQETAPFQTGQITIMAVDNLPGSLPRDASEDFGNMLIRDVIPCLLREDPEGIIERASILENGRLTSRYNYLRKYLEGTA